MHFDSGKFGAIIVVLSIVLTIVIGYCSDVTKVEVEKTDYDYITDITGLFETEQVPEYIDYNPNSNYVGYTGPVVYETSNQPNNYRYVIEEGTSTTLTSATVNSSSNYGAPYTYDDGYLYSFPCYYSGSTYDMGNPSYISSNKLYNLTSNSNYTTDLSKILPTLIPSIETYSEVEINVVQNATWPSFMYPYTSIQKISNVQSWVELTDSNVVTRITINPATMIATAYVGDNVSFSCPTNQFFIQENYTTLKDGNSANPSATLTPIVTTPPVYGYADPTAGVTYSSGQTGSLIWLNGYINESIRVLIGRNPNTSGVWSTGEFNFLDIVSLDDFAITNFEISWNPSGELLIGTDTPTNLGKWQGAIVDFNYITGELVVTPTGTIRDYMEVPSIQGDPYTYQESWEGVEGENPVTSMSYIKSDTNDVRWGVQNTRVNLNTYDVVMNNPSIDIHDYWPNLDYYRLNFYSYALVGDSITINGVTYPIGDGQTITVTDVDGKTYTDVLSNIYVTVNGEDGTKRTSLTFVDSRTTVDLGETVSEVVSYSGLWYFTTALYDAETVLVSEYEWNLDGDWSATSGQVLAIFLGLCVGGILIGRVFFKDSLGGWDYLVIGIAIVIAFAIAEVFV